jgi:hypothetical protein
MRGERGEGRGPKDRGARSSEKDPTDVVENLDTLFDRFNVKQIENLLFQSTQGLHFIFENSDIAKVLGKPSNDKNFFNEENVQKVQGLLSGILDCPGLHEKRSFLERLPSEDFELLVRSYFQLVENAILASSDVRH